MAGTIYVAKDTEKPGRCKIGYSGRDGAARTSETTNPDYILVKSFFISGYAHHLERVLHSVIERNGYKRIKHRRTGNPSEWFKCSANKAIDIIQDYLCKHYYDRYVQIGDLELAKKIEGIRDRRVKEKERAVEDEKERILKEHTHIFLLLDECKESYEKGRVFLHQKVNEELAVKDSLFTKGRLIFSAIFCLIFFRLLLAISGDYIMLVLPAVFIGLLFVGLSQSVPPSISKQIYTKFHAWSNQDIIDSLDQKLSVFYENFYFVELPIIDPVEDMGMSYNELKSICTRLKNSDKFILSAIAESKDNINSSK